MAARIKPLSPTKLDEMRKRIRTTLLLKKLEDHVLGQETMTQSQIKAAEILLKKAMPDLSAIEHTGEVVNTHARELTDDELASIATGSSGGASEAPQSADESPSVH